MKSGGGVLLKATGFKKKRIFKKKNVFGKRVFFGRTFLEKALPRAQIARILVKNTFLFDIRRT